MNKFTTADNAQRFFSCTLWYLTIVAKTTKTSLCDNLLAFRHAYRDICLCCGYQQNGMSIGLVVSVCYHGLTLCLCHSVLPPDSHGDYVIFL